MVEISLLLLCLLRFAWFDIYPRCCVSVMEAALVLTITPLSSFLVKGPLCRVLLLPAAQPLPPSASPGYLSRQRPWMLRENSASSLCVSHIFWELETTNFDSRLHLHLARLFSFSKLEGNGIFYSSLSSTGEFSKKNLYLQLTETNSYHSSWSLCSDSCGGKIQSQSMRIGH